MKSERNGAGWIALQSDKMRHARENPHRHPITYRVWGTKGNSLPELFAEGFRAGLALWKTGETFESISHRGREVACEAAGRGLYAASEALAGWYDVAEREARAFGMTREQAAALAIEAKEA